MKTKIIILCCVTMIIGACASVIPWYYWIHLAGDSIESEPEMFGLFHSIMDACLLGLISGIIAAIITRSGFWGGVWDCVGGIFGAALVDCVVIAGIFAVLGFTGYQTKNTHFGGVFFVGGTLCLIWNGIIGAAICTGNALFGISGMDGDFMSGKVNKRSFQRLPLAIALAIRRSNKKFGRH